LIHGAHSACFWALVTILDCPWTPCVWMFFVLFLPVDFHFHSVCSVKIQAVI
jgi:hypothetical protein